jgi:hypothetical protein
MMECRVHGRILLSEGAVEYILLYPEVGEFLEEAVRELFVTEGEEDSLLEVLLSGSLSECSVEAIYRGLRGGRVFVKEVAEIAVCVGDGEGIRIDGENIGRIREELRDLRRKWAEKTEWRYLPKEGRIRGLISRMAMAIGAGEEERRLGLAQILLVQGRYRDALAELERLKYSATPNSMVARELVLGCKMEMGMGLEEEYVVAKEVLCPEVSVHSAKYVLLLCMGARGLDGEEMGRRLFIASVVGSMIDTGGQPTLRAAINIAAFWALSLLEIEVKRRVFLLMETSELLYALCGSRVEAAIGAMESALRMCREESGEIWREAEEEAALRLAEMALVGEESIKSIQMVVANDKNFKRVLKIAGRYGVGNGAGPIHSEITANVEVRRGGADGKEGDRNISVFRNSLDRGVVYGKGIRHAVRQGEPMKILLSFGSSDVQAEDVCVVLSGSIRRMRRRENKFVLHVRAEKGVFSISKILYRMEGVALCTSLEIGIPVLEEEHVRTEIRYEKSAPLNGKSPVTITGLIEVRSRNLFLVEKGGILEGYERVSRGRRMIRGKAEELVAARIQRELQGEVEARVSVRRTRCGNVLVRGDIKGMKAEGEWRVREVKGGYYLKRKIRRRAGVDSSPEELVHAHDMEEGRIAEVVDAVVRGEIEYREKVLLASAEMLEKRDVFYRRDPFVQWTVTHTGTDRRNVLERMEMTLGTDPIVEIVTENGSVYRRIYIERHVFGNSYALYRDWKSELQRAALRSLFAETIDKIEGLAGLLSRLQPPRSQGAEKDTWTRDGIEARLCRRRNKVYIRNYSFFRRFRVTIRAAANYEVVVGKGDSLVFALKTENLSDLEIEGY